MKKHLAALTAWTLCLCTLLSGCSSSPSDTGQSSDSSSGHGDKTITYWSIGTSEPDATILQRAVDKFNETTKSGYTVELINYPTDNYKEKLTIAMSSGECPDIYTNWTGGPLLEYINAGYAQPITDKVKALGLDKKIMPSALNQGTINDELYALPFFNIAIEGFFYNKEIFEEYGFEEPETLSELEAICDALVENNITPFALANASKWTGSMYFMGLATRYGGLEPFNNAYNGSGSFEDECFEYAGTKIQEWVKKGYFPEGVNSLSFDDGQDKQLMYQETAAMMLQGSWQTSTFSADSKEFYAKIGWFPFPAIEGSSADTSIQIGTVGDIFMTFNCTGEKLDAALEMASLYFEDEAIQLAVDSGYLPPVNNITDLVSDEVSKKNLEAAMNASTIQLWYDQYLPPTVSTAHQDTCQEMFGLTMTPQEADKKLQDAMQDYLKQNEKK